jgi:hypothetical protein
VSFLTVFRRHVRTDRLYDTETNDHIGCWHTVGADWYIARGERTRHGVSYSYDGLENEKGFKTKREAIERRKELEGVR